MLKKKKVKVNVEIEGISPLMMNRMGETEERAKRRLKKIKAHSVIQIIGSKVKWLLKI